MDPDVEDDYILPDDTVQDDSEPADFNVIEFAESNLVFIEHSGAFDSRVPNLSMIIRKFLKFSYFDIEVAKELLSLIVHYSRQLDDLDIFSNYLLRFLGPISPENPRDPEYPIWNSDNYMNLIRDPNFKIKFRDYILYHNPLTIVYKNRYLERKKLVKKPAGDIKGDYKCSNGICNSYNTRAVPKQTRGADEGMTIIITCNDCHHTSSH